MDWKELLKAVVFVALIGSASPFNSRRTLKDDRNLTGTSLSEDAWGDIRSKFHRATELMTRSVQKSVEESLIGGTKGRSKRESAFQFQLLRDEKGVAVAEQMVPLGTIGGRVHSSLQLGRIILMASSREQNIVISSFDTSTLQVSEIGQFPGTGSCGFAEPLGRILIACGPIFPSISSIAVDVLVTVRELVRSAAGYRLTNLQPVFRRSLLSSAAWQQDGYEYWLLAGEYTANSTEGAFRSSNRFFSMKSSQALDFDAAIHLYRWVAHRYDLVESLPAHRPVAVAHFLVNNFHFFVVAEGERGFWSGVYRYSLDLKRYVLLQRLPTAGGAVGLEVFTLGMSVERDTFIALAFQCASACKNNHTVVIFKYANGKFLPFQALQVPSPKAIESLETADGVLLVVLSTEGSLHYYQHNGWRFVAVAPVQPRDIGKISGMVALSSGAQRSLITFNSESPSTGHEAATFYEVQYTVKAPLKEFYASLAAAVQTSLQTAGVARSVMSLAEEAPKTNEAFTFTSPVTFRQNLSVDKMTANKVYSPAGELPSTVEDSFKTLKLLQQNHALLRHRQLKLVSLSSPEKWPRTLRASAVSVLGNSSVSSLRVKQTVNGFPVPSESSLVPISTHRPFRVSSLQFDTVALEADFTVEKMNNIPFDDYVTPSGDHNISGSVTFLDTVKTPKVDSLGLVNGHKLENYLTRSAHQNVTGNFRCRLGKIKQLSVDILNKVAMQQLLDTAVSLHSDVHIRGSLVVAKNVSCKNNLRVGTVSGEDLDAFAARVLLKRSSEPQIISGQYQLEALQAPSLKLRGLLNNVSMDDLFVNRPHLHHTLASANFMGLSAEKLTISGRLNDITASTNQSLDILLLNKNQTVTGAKTFRGLHLSDVFDEDDQIKTTTSTTPQEPTRSTFSFNEERPTIREKLSLIRSKISVLGDVMEKLDALEAKLPVQPNTTGGYYRTTFCEGIFTKLNDAHSTTDLISWNSQMTRDLNDCSSFVLGFLQRWSGQLAIFSKMFESLAKKLNLAKGSLLEEIRVLEIEERTLESLITTEAPPVTLPDTNNRWLVELDRLRRKLNNLEDELFELESQLNSRSNQKNHTDGFSSSGFPITELQKNSSHTLSDVSDRIRQVKIERAKVMQSIHVLEPSVIGVPLGNKGSGSYVYGKVAGQNLAELNALLESLTPSEVELQDFFRRNSSLIGKMEFRSDLTLGNLNRMDIYDLQRKLIPISTSVLPFTMTLTGETEVLGDLRAASVNAIPTRNFLTLGGNHTLFHEFVFKGTVHSEANIEADLVNGVDLSKESQLLAKTNESQEFAHSIEFTDLLAPSVFADNLTVSGVNFSDVVLKSANSTLTGRNVFTSQLVLQNDTDIVKLQATSINNIDLNKLFTSTVRKTGNKPQKIIGEKFFNSLESRRNISTNGFIRSSTSENQPSNSVFNLTWFSEHAFKLDEGGSLKNLRVTGEVEINSLNCKGFIDDVKFPGNWLRSEGDQNLTANIVYLTKLSADDVHSFSDNVLDTLVTDTVKTNEPYTFTDKVVFEKFITTKDLRVRGRVQGLSIPEDLVSKFESNVRVTGHKFFINTVKSFVEVLGYVNGVKVDKLCDANALNSLTVSGDSIFNSALVARQVKTGKHVISDEVLKNFWKEDVPTILPGDFTFKIVNSPTGITTRKINGRKVEEIFQSLLNRSCLNSNISTNWSFDRLSVNNVVAKNIQAAFFQGVPTIELGDILLKSSDQFISDLHSVESIRARDLTVFGNVNGVRPSSFCTTAKQCLVTVPKHFEANVEVENDVYIKPGSTINGLVLREEAARLVAKSEGGFIPGQTTIIGNLSARNIRAELVNGKPVTRSRLFTKSDHQVIRPDFFVASKKGPTVHAAAIKTRDGRFSNYSLEDIFQKSVRRGEAEHLVVEGRTVFDKAVTFYHADSAFAAPKISPPEDLAILEKDFSDLQDALKAGELDSKESRVWGWKLVAEIQAADWHKVVHLGYFHEESYLALIPWRGDARVLTYKDSKLHDKGIRIRGSCISDVKAWVEEADVRFVSSDACPTEAAAEEDSVSAGWRIDILVYDNITLPILQIAGGVPRGAFAWRNAQGECIGLLSTSSTVIPVVCKQGEKYVLRQNLQIERPVQALALNIGNSMVIITASLGKDPYGGSLDVWRYNETRRQYAVLNTVLEPGICSIAAAAIGLEHYVASVSRHFKGNLKAVSVYRYGEGSAELSLVQRFPVRSAREVALVDSAALGEVVLFVHTAEGDLLRYTASYGDRFQEAGKLQARRVISFATWTASLGRPDASEDTQIFVGVVEKNPRAERTRGSFLLYQCVL